MYSTSKEIVGDGRQRTFDARLRRCLGASAIVLAGLIVADPAFARSPYDGAWGVTVMTRSGACQPASRFAVQISNGAIIAGGGEAAVQGRVAPGGAVSVAVQSGGQSASGSGRLNLARGGGMWRGQGSAGVCGGTWVAQRLSGMQTAEAPGIDMSMPLRMQRPIYNFAPAGMGPPAAAACAARFRSYDPATGTFMGFDGMRHPCP
jgi:BA14K-like protein